MSQKIAELKRNSDSVFKKTMNQKVRRKEGQEISEDEIVEGK
jgi:hypothetical protein